MSRNTTNAPTGAIQWILANVNLRECNTVEFRYNHWDSLSNGEIPIIYQSFNATNGNHFGRRAREWDFICAVGNGKLLDFGMGDGWPSLNVAPLAQEVVGVDATRRFVDVATENAKRCDITNATFVYVPAGEPLPFEDDFFDGAMAASSVEQTPEPRETLREICRVLRPGGRFRIDWEGLEFYRGRQEQEFSLSSADDNATHLSILERDIDNELVREIRLTLGLSSELAKEIFRRHGQEVSFAGLTPDVLRDLCKNLVDAELCITNHPSCHTLVGWLKEIGFSSILPTYNGGWFARRLFKRIPEEERPKDLAGVDALLRPIVEVVITMETTDMGGPGEWGPVMITAVK
jgi:SAM-dependent methyltransferase